VNGRHSHAACSPYDACGSLDEVVLRVRRHDACLAIHDEKSGVSDIESEAGWRFKAG
jgi:hypothetical protein